jgi:indolepyruvate ferredoxin oxidoreductase alpha subunit
LKQAAIMLLGDEAIAQGALDAGVSGFYAYPGTPSTEIMEYAQRAEAAIERNVHRAWSANEKTALESALGMSYAGKRAMACMKHVGLNVAADPFINSAITGVNGGLIVTVADDPSMHSSQNEQDSRFYGKFALLPMLEPSNQQEAYDMCRYGFELSESFQLPVLLRITTRLAHSRAGVNTRPPLSLRDLRMPQDMRQFVLLPAIARKRYRMLIDLQPRLLEEAQNSVFNRYQDGPDHSLGIIACGLGVNYVYESFGKGGCPYPLLKIGQYPVPVSLVTRLAAECERVLVVEEGMPFLEEMLRGILDPCVSISGRLDETLPRDGELTPNRVQVALGMPDECGDAVPDIVRSRPPALCKGCSHIDTYKALNEAVKNVYGDGHVFSDIGCYTLGALPPFQAINSCVDMGASITMAKGAADAGMRPVVAVIGDSTFCHSGMTGLLDAILENTPMLVMILDNSATAMTGGQHSHAFGRLEKICLGLGVEREHLHLINPVPKNHQEFVSLIRRELAHEGVSVIIPTRECIQTLKTHSRRKSSEA